MQKDSILVLSVDRDNDIGEKTRFRGPIRGREDVQKCAVELGLSDPEDSDFNALFQTIRVYEEIKKEHMAEIAVFTGHRDVGLKSDREIAKQLDSVLANFKADYIILVTDGSEDDHIIPVLQSRVPILSVKRVVVKQSEQLESTYFKIKDFIDESLENPKFARLIFGLPALALLLYALFGLEGWRAIVGVVGIYLFIKGFKLEKYITGSYEELSTSLTRRRFSFFMYIVAIAIGILAIFRGYDLSLPWFDTGILEGITAFISSSVYFFFIAGTVAWIGRNIGVSHMNLKKVSSVIIFGFAISLVVYNAAELILKPELTIFNFVVSILLGFALLFIALFIEWKR